VGSCRVSKPSAFVVRSGKAHPDGGNSCQFGIHVGRQTPEGGLSAHSGDRNIPACSLVILVYPF
jgi:hypothetical protein